jgi:hypothetical protein
MSGGGDEVQSLLKAIRGKMIVLQMKCRSGVILNLGCFKLIITKCWIEL